MQSVSGTYIKDNFSREICKFLVIFLSLVTRPVHQVSGSVNLAKMLMSNKCVTFLQVSTCTKPL